MRMRSRWLRQIACITAVAVLLANTPGLLAGTRLATGTPSCHDSRHGPGCQCCDGCDDTPVTSTSDHPATENSEVVTAIATASPDDGQQSCPCCPHCPGCAWCSVSHVLSVAPAVLSLVGDVGRGENLAEFALLFPPGHCGKLIRPPRG